MNNNYKVLTHELIRLLLIKNANGNTQRSAERLIDCERDQRLLPVILLLIVTIIIAPISISTKVNTMITWPNERMKDNSPRKSLVKLLLMTVNR